MNVPKFVPVSKPLDLPVMGKFKAIFRSRDGTTIESDYVADSFTSVFERIKAKRVVFPFLLVLRLDGIYYYNQFYPLDSIEDCPLDVDIIFNLIF